MEGLLRLRKSSEKDGHWADGIMDVRNPLPSLWILQCQLAQDDYAFTGAHTSDVGQSKNSLLTAISGSNPMRFSGVAFPTSANVLEEDVNAKL